MSNIISKLDKYLGKTLREDKDPDSRTNAEVVGEVFDKYVEGNQEFQHKLKEIVWNIVKMRAKEGEANDDLQGKKESIIKGIYAELRAKLNETIDAETRKVFEAQGR